MVESAASDICHINNINTIMHTIRGNLHFSAAVRSIYLFLKKQIYDFLKPFILFINQIR